MSMSRAMLLGLAAAASIAGATPAFAEGGEIPGDYLTVVYPDGHSMVMPVDKKAVGMMMTYSKPNAGRVMVLVSQGKTYMIEDTKMPSGEMLSDYLAGTFASSKH